jgi:hypothetical protein
MELSDLVGLHELTAVDEGTELRKSWGSEEQCNAIYFTLDGVTYAVVEDPEDGYRSHARDIEVVERAMKNVFPPCKVVARHVTHAQMGSADMLVLTDTTTGRDVLTVGTSNTDDYYPCYEADFDPRAMAVNAVQSIG